MQWAYRDRYTTMGQEMPEGIQHGYNLIGARLSWSFLDGRAQVALWGANLLDEAYFQDVVPDREYGRDLRRALVRDAAHLRR